MFCMINGHVYGTYIEILKRELIPSLGCTEPVAIAYGAAVARKVLGEHPDKICVGVSNNVIKNVKSVVVPNTGGLKGIKASVLAGIIGGKADRKLEVILSVSEEEIQRIHRAMEGEEVEVKPLESSSPLDILVDLWAGKNNVRVRISHSHANVVEVIKNGKPLPEWTRGEETGDGGADYSLLNLKDIVEFADTVDINLLREILERQIDFNSKIAEEGLTSNWGANIGKTLLKINGDNVKTRAIAGACAGSDARMSGCPLPVIINSGSGNQGITVSVPVIEYARELGASREKLLRALIISNLISIHSKRGIGTLSAFCGAATAGCAAGCGIGYLMGGTYETLAHTLVNSLAIISGIICDGAKPSCAGKIASSLEAGILGYWMYMDGHEFKFGEGIVSNSVETTIENIHHLGKEGMKQTDDEIVKLMLKWGC